MKKSILVSLISSFLLTSCCLPLVGDLFNKKTKESENVNQDQLNSGTNSNTENDPSVTDPSNLNTQEEVDPNARLLSIYFAKKSLDLQINKYEYVNPSFITNSNITVDDLTYEEKAGTFASSDTAIATVSEHGKITAVGIGSAVITYRTTLGKYVASMTVYTYNSLSDIKREYLRLDNPDDIEVGDELIFACPDFGVAASVNSQSGYILPAACSFTNDGAKITDKSASVAEYYVGPGDTETNFTFESQNNEYLACRSTSGGNKLSYSDNGKAQINWIVEIPTGYTDSFIVSDDLRVDYWLMFNKVSKDNSDIRLNIYDSNETQLMKKPIIYRKTVIHN